MVIAHDSGVQPNFGCSPFARSACSSSLSASSLLCAHWNPGGPARKPVMKGLIRCRLWEACKKASVCLCLLLKQEERAQRSPIRWPDLFLLLCIQAGRHDRFDWWLHWAFTATLLWHSKSTAVEFMYLLVMFFSIIILIHGTVDLLLVGQIGWLIKTSHTHWYQHIWPLALRSFKFHYKETFRFFFKQVTDHFENSNLPVCLVVACLACY